MFDHFKALDRLQQIRDFLGIIKLGSCFIKSQTGRFVIWPPIYFVHKIALFYSPIDRFKLWVSHLGSYCIISLIIVNKSTTRVGWLAVLEASHLKFKVWHFWSGQGYWREKTSQGYCLLLYIYYFILKYFFSVYILKILFVLLYPLLNPWLQREFTAHDTHTKMYMDLFIMIENKPSIGQNIYKNEKD